jgi:hypothetical protein
MNKVVGLYQGSGRENRDCGCQTALNIWNKVFCTNGCDSQGSWSLNFISAT